MRGERQKKKHAGTPHQKPIDESKINRAVEMKSEVGPAFEKRSVLLRRGTTQSGRAQKSGLTKVVGPASSKKLPDGLKSSHAKEAARKKDRRQSMKREGEETVQRGRLGPTFQSQPSTSHRGRMVFKKLPARGTTAVEFPSGTSTSCTMTEWTDESASGTSQSSYAMLSGRPSRPSMRKKSLTRQYAQRKYSSSSSSSSSPGWLVSRPASSLRRQRAVRDEPKKRGRLRRFKDKLAVIFHHHHHHHHHRSSSGDSEEESPTPSEDPRHGGSMPKHLGKIQGGGGGAVMRAPCRREEHHHGHLYTLLQRLLRHIWDSRMEEEDKVCRRREIGKKGVGRNGDKKKGWWQGGGGVKLGISRKKQRFVLGFPKAQRKKTQVLCHEKEY